MVLGLVLCGPPPLQELLPGLAGLSFCLYCYNTAWEKDRLLSPLLSHEIAQKADKQFFDSGSVCA